MSGEGISKISKKVIYFIITVKSWRSVLLMEETGVSGENHKPASSH
jgi:hypothetical protein